jgi:hypothetical protein
MLASVNRLFLFRAPALLASLRSAGLSGDANTSIPTLLLNAPPGPGVRLPEDLWRGACAWGCCARRGEDGRVVPFRRAATQRSAPAAAPLQVAPGPDGFFVVPPPRAPGTASSGRLESASAQRATRREPSGGQTPGIGGVSLRSLGRSKYTSTSRPHPARLPSLCTRRGGTPSPSASLREMIHVGLTGREKRQPRRPVVDSGA